MREKEAVKDERQRKILNMINKNYTKEQILDIGYSEEEYKQAVASLVAIG
jgi:hypothetical protein